MSKITLICPPCCVCKKAAHVEVDELRFLLYEQGASAQVAFADLSNEAREQIITGTHPECWNKLFPPEKEE